MLRKNPATLAMLPQFRLRKQSVGARVESI